MQDKIQKPEQIEVRITSEDGRLLGSVLRYHVPLPILVPDNTRYWTGATMERLKEFKPQVSIKYFQGA